MAEVDKMLRDLSFDFGAPEPALRIWYDAEERTFQREERTVRAPPTQTSQGCMCRNICPALG
jgi:hypothetical protein